MRRIILSFGISLVSSLASLTQSLEEYIGAYNSEELRSSLTINLVKDRLKLRIEGTDQSEYTYLIDLSPK